MIYFRYLWAILKHKAYILQFGYMLKVPLWLLIIHDWSKFLPSEFGRFARDGRGYPKDGEPIGGDEFQEAWLFHESRNKHHWGFWIPGSGKMAGKPLPMPEAYVREMVADWLTVSKSKTGQMNISVWLNENGPKMLLHQDTLNHVNDIMIEMNYCLTDNCDWSWLAPYSMLK